MELSASPKAGFPTPPNLLKSAVLPNTFVSPLDLTRSEKLARPPDPPSTGPDEVVVTAVGAGGAGVGAVFVKSAVILITEQEWVYFER